MDGAGQQKNSTIYFLVLFSGIAALSWSVIWQIKSSLALGVSAWGAALTLAVTMTGMCIGALLAGGTLKDRKKINALRLYGVLEVLIGLAGLLLASAMQLAEQMDTNAYRSTESGLYLIHIMGIAFSIGFPAICMGATTPVFGLIARQYGTSISVLYGLNTLGAAAGSILGAFFLIPSLGVQGAIYAIASINIIVGAFAIASGKSAFAGAYERKTASQTGSSLRGWQEYLVVASTGFATLALEVAWFRSFTAAFWSTTAAFSIMLASVLLSLGIAAQIAPVLRARNYNLSSFLAIAGISILLATPMIERFDLITRIVSFNPAALFANWFFMSFIVTVIPITMLGISLPWILDAQNTPRRWATLYGVNTFASVIGSLLAGWVLLPAIGFARTSWLIGVIVLIVSLLLMSAEEKKQLRLLALGLTALVIAMVLESGVGRTRVQMHTAWNSENKPVIVESAEGPDTTVSVVEYSKSKDRALIIDGFIATGQAPSGGQSGLMVQYMLWMGHLPMLLHPAPQDALVICFGTGQTANALRRENPESLTIVDINQNVFRMAHHFESNEGVLKDPRVKPLVMDGRAFLRRTEKKFDVITLEPMPPTFAGVNALYSREFYELAAQRMNKGGIIAQWLPYHLVSTYHASAISRTFNQVFPNAILWIDPQSLTGILLGTKDETIPLGAAFPDFERNRATRLLPEETIRESIYLDPEGMKKFSKEYGQVITDDNQLLSYGSSNFYTHTDAEQMLLDNYLMLKAFKKSFYKDKKAEVENFEKLIEQKEKSGKQ